MKPLAERIEELKALNEAAWDEQGYDRFIEKLIPMLPDLLAEIERLKCPYPYPDQDKKLTALLPKFAIFIEPRPDGGIRISSDDLPGLILSASNPHRCLSTLWHSVMALVEHGQSPEPKTAELALSTVRREALEEAKKVIAETSPMRWAQNTTSAAAYERGLLIKVIDALIDKPGKDLENRVALTAEQSRSDLSSTDAGAPTKAVEETPPVALANESATQFSKEGWRTDMENAPSGRMLLVANPNSGPVPVIAIKNEGNWRHGCPLTSLEPAPTLWMKHPLVPAPPAQQGE